jgi:hypothetical protein
MNMPAGAAAEQPKGDLLARAYLRLLARNDAAEWPAEDAGDGDDPVVALVGGIGGQRPQRRLAIRPELAAVAVMTARTIEAVPNLARELRRGAPVVAISVGTPDLV